MTADTIWAKLIADSIFYRICFQGRKSNVVIIITIIVLPSSDVTAYELFLVVGSL